MAATEEPGNIPQELIGFFESKALFPSQSYQDVWGQEHQVAFAVAGIMELDIIADVKEAIVQAQTQGTDFEAFKKQIAPVFERNGWFGKPYKTKKSKSRRLNTIYQTNLRMARSNGQWERIKRRKRLQPALRYRLGPSAKHRPEHVAFDGLIYPVDHPFWQTHMPPNGYGCNCWVEPLTRALVNKHGGVSDDLDPRLFPDQHYRDPRDGKKRTAPYGVDPGFECKPGLRGRKQGLSMAKSDRE